MPGITFSQTVALLVIALTSVSASPTPHEILDPTTSCPASNGQTVNIGSSLFAISCNYDFYSGDMSKSPRNWTVFLILTFWIAGMSWESSLTKCLSTCDITPGCIVVSYTGGACYMKSRNNGGQPAVGIWSAQKVAKLPFSASNAASTTLSSSASIAKANSSPSTLSCPASHGSMYTSAGSIFKIECYTDHFGGDTRLSWEYNLQSCIESCDATTDCIDVSYRPGSPGPCYMKSAVLSTGTNPNIWGALRSGIASKVSSVTSNSIAVPSSSSSPWPSTSSSTSPNSTTVITSSPAASNSTTSPISSSIAPSPSLPSPPPPPIPSIGCGIIPDPDMETPGTTLDWHILSNFTTNSSTSAGFYRTQASTETSHKGLNVFYTLSTSPDDSVAWGTTILQLTAGIRYTVSFWVRKNAPGTSVVFVDGLQRGTVPAGGDLLWHQYEVGFAAQGERAGLVFVSACPGYGGFCGQIFDDFAVMVEGGVCTA
ncbi:hypothetical protein BU16DRAFT_566314 [Lophium mytilinum]|uniref:Apple domain-containing protein n=1 Tax=Lophium mytilinum TaxID=390894 RepID=A0A6A6QDC6_9PEZI|nr:hypothetical protein BU16DRAFT_566314 [Lophium mytilinum]